MKKIVIFNRKGGTGKTATAVNLAHGLAMKGKHVLLIDCDPQGNVATWLGVASKQTLYHLLMDAAELPDCVVSARENLDVIASNETLIAADQALVGEVGREKVLTEKLQGLRGYDYAILDCPPSLSIVAQNALMYADRVIVPLTMDYLALEALKKIVKNLEQIKSRLGRRIELALIVPAFYDDRINLFRECLAELRERFPGRVSEPIRKNVRIKEAAGAKQTIFEYAPSSLGAEDYQKLVERVHHGK
jgi:chromosome partitioning protein